MLSGRDQCAGRANELWRHLHRSLKNEIPRRCVLRTILESFPRPRRHAARDRWGSSSDCPTISLSHHLYRPTPPLTHISLFSISPIFDNDRYCCCIIHCECCAPRVKIGRYSNARATPAVVALHTDWVQRSARVLSGHSITNQS